MDWSRNIDIKEGKKEESKNGIEERERCIVGTLLRDCIDLSPIYY